MSDTAPSPTAPPAPGRFRLFIVLGCVTAIGPVSMDVYLPGFPGLARDFDVDAPAAQLTMTTYLCGMVLGQLLSGSLSDIYGRRRPLIAGMVLFGASSVACAIAPSLSVLAALRFVQGAAAVGGIAIGRAVVRDVYEGAAAARYLSRLLLIVGIGPIVAPIVGGELLRYTSWRGVFVSLAAFGIVLAVLAAWLLPETLSPESRRTAGVRATAQTFRALLRDRRFVSFVLILGLAAGAVFGYIAGSSFVLEDVYGASPQLYGVLFGLNALCLVIGAQINAHLLRRRSPYALLRFGLVTMVVSGAALLAVAPFPEAGLAVILPPLALLMFSWSFVNANTVALALTDLPAVAGTAAALLGVSQFAFGAALVPLVGVGSAESGLPMAVVIAACGAGAYVAFRRLPAQRPPRYVGTAKGELSP